MSVKSRKEVETMSLADTFYEDNKNGKYNFWVLQNESEENKKLLYNMFNSFVNHKEEQKIVMKTENGLKFRHLAEKYKLKGITVTPERNTFYDYNYRIDINIKQALTNLHKFYSPN